MSFGSNGTSSSHKNWKEDQIRGNSNQQLDHQTLACPHLLSSFFTLNLVSSLKMDTTVSNIKYNNNSYLSLRRSLLPFLGVSWVVGLIFSFCWKGCFACRGVGRPSDSRWKQGLPSFGWRKRGKGFQALLFSG
jgi:hypothetical protein